MGRVIGIMGESGSGKTTAMRNLDPFTTYYIDADKKGLSWAGWRKQYSTSQGNYLVTDNPDTVLYVLASINGDEAKREAVCKKMQTRYAPLSEESRKMKLAIKTIVIDTLNGIMVSHEIRNMKKPGYDKWIDLASFVYDIVDYSLTVREDLTVIFLCHSETIRDDFGNAFTRIKTNGRKLEKIVLESKFPCVFYAGGYEEGFKLYTRHANCTCKTPYGAFQDEAIPNDITLALKVLEDF